MKRILSAIANALKSTCSFVWDKCARTGEWTLRAVASIGGTAAGAPSTIAEEVIDPEYGSAADVVPADDGSVDKLLTKSKALLDTLGLVSPSPGDNYDRIKRICADWTAGGWGDEWDIAKLSFLQADWLEHMTPEMHKLVAEASREDLIAHMRGGKSIRGLIRCDQESLKDWKRSNEMEKARAAYEVEAPVVGEPEWAQGPMPAC